MPLLENWSLCDARGCFTPEPGEKLHLAGSVFDHPNYPFILHGEPVITTAVAELDLKARTAKTRNTLYRLGKPDSKFLERLKERGVDLSQYEVQEEHVLSERERDRASSQ